MSWRQFMVKVGTDPATAQGDNAQFAGEHYHGPMTEIEAYEFAGEVTREFAKIADDDASRFVYGTPVVEVLQLDGRSDPRDYRAYESRAAKAASNWYSDS